MLCPVMVITRIKNGISTVTLSMKNEKKEDCRLHKEIFYLQFYDTPADATPNMALTRVCVVKINDFTPT